MRQLLSLGVQALASLPADSAALPTVSIVVPNLQNDMHDGTIAQADTWLHDRWDPYVQWAKQHNVPDQGVPAAAPESAAWQASVSDATSALQARGSVGPQVLLQVYASSGSTVTPVTLRASDFSARPATGP